MRRTFVLVVVVLVLAVVVGSGAVAVLAARKSTKKAAICTGWRMHGLPRAHDIAAGGGKAWLLTESGLFRWTETCGWEIRSRQAARRPGPDEATDGPLWIDKENQLWLHTKWKGRQVCDSPPPDMIVHCHTEGGGESVSRFDDETGTWIRESEAPTEMPASRTAPTVSAITEKSPDSRLLAMAEDGERAWVVATRYRRSESGGWTSLGVPELWERASRNGDWTVRLPIGAAHFTGTEPIDEIVVERERIYAGIAGVAMRLDGDTWVAVGNHDPYPYRELVGMVVFDGVPWLANACEVARHVNGQPPESELWAGTGCGFHAMWGRAANLIWVAGWEVVKRFNGRTWSDLPKPPSSVPRAIWGAAENDVWIGGSSLQHWNGSTWTETDKRLVEACSSNGSDLWVTALGGTGTKDVWAVGSYCGKGTFAAHWDGRSWTLQTEGFGKPRALDALFVRGKNDVYAVGNGVHHWNGKTWAELPAPSGAHLRSVAVTKDSIWVGDEHGTIFQRRR